MAEDVENKEQVDSTEGTENLKVLENIDVMLTVEVGRTEITDKGFTEIERRIGCRVRSFSR